MSRTWTRNLLGSVLSMFIFTLFGARSAAAESGFAKVSANGTLVTVGGPNTNTATTAHLAPGVYDITFNGNYPSQTTVDNVVVNTTAEVLQWGVSNASVLFADANQITVRVFTWRSSDTTQFVDNAFFIAVFTTPDPIAAAVAGKGTEVSPRTFCTFRANCRSGVSGSSYGDGHHVCSGTMLC